jgi:glucose-6-phosphate 1-dehydrogenase
MRPGNPFHDPLRFARQGSECAVVIFGAHGDLTRRKLAPALYRLFSERGLSAGFAMVGISRTPMSDEQFRDRLREAVAAETEFDAGVWESFARGIYYMPGDVNDPEMYSRLAAKLSEIESERHTGGNVLFYLSTQPSQYAPVALGIGGGGAQSRQGLAPAGGGETFRARSRKRA